MSLISPFTALCLSFLICEMGIKLLTWYAEHSEALPTVKKCDVRASFHYFDYVRRAGIKVIANGPRVLIHLLLISYVSFPTFLVYHVSLVPFDKVLLINP